MVIVIILCRPKVILLYGGHCIINACIFSRVWFLDLQKISFNGGRISSNLDLMIGDRTWSVRTHWRKYVAKSPRVFPKINRTEAVTFCPSPYLTLLTAKKSDFFLQIQWKIITQLLSIFYFYFIVKAHYFSIYNSYYLKFKSNYNYNLYVFLNKRWKGICLYREVLK